MLACAVAGLMFAMAGLGAAAIAAEPSSADLHGLRSRIDSLKKEIESGEADRKEVADGLKHSERAISNLNRSLTQLARDQKELAASLVDIQIQEERLAKEAAVQEARLGRLLSYLYRQGGQGQNHIVFLLAHNGSGRLSRDLEYFSYLTRQRADFVGRLRGNLEELAILQEQTAAKQSELETNLKKQSQEKVELEQAHSQRTVVLARIADKLKDQKEQVARLERDERRLTRLVRRIDDAIKAEPAEEKPPARLSSRRVYPVQGKLVGRYGQRRPDGGRPWRGLFIAAKQGAPVKAAADGKVVFSDWLRGFGNMVIVDHGEGYMTLYANNETLFKQVGDSVRGGDTVASVGNSGGNPDSGLYFELRYQSKPVDPSLWLARSG